MKNETKQSRAHQESNNALHGRSTMNTIKETAMNLRHPLSALILPVVLAAGGCGGTEADFYADEAANADPSIVASYGKAKPYAADRNDPNNLYACPYYRRQLGTAADLLPEDYCDGGGGGGGGGGTTTPPPPPVDTTYSYLDAGARTYLTQAGVYDSSTVGGTMWVNACKVSAYQGAGTFNSGVYNSCTWANTLPGWIIIEASYDVLENRNDRGSASVSATNGPVTISRVDFGSKFNLAIEAALSYGDLTAKGKLDLEYQRLNGYQFHFDGQGNQIVASVIANGGLFRSSRIEIQAKAKLLRIY